MRWMIYGADSKTGRELSVVVEADDPKEAADWMYYNDILVSSVAEFTASQAELHRAALTAPPARAAPALDYYAEDRPPDDRPPLAAPPAYREVLWGARWLHAIAVFTQVIACLLLAVGGAAVVVSFVDEWQQRLAPKVQVAEIVWLAGGCALLALALLLFLVASMISMMSGLALAVRDVARNSFAPPCLTGAAGEAVRETAQTGPVHLSARQRAVELLSPDEASWSLLPPSPPTPLLARAASGRQ